MKKSAKSTRAAVIAEATEAQTIPLSASLQEFRAAWRATREAVIRVDGRAVKVVWHPLTDAELEPIIARTRLAIPPLKPAVDGALPQYDRHDPAYLARRQRVETQARALAVFYAVPELSAEFARQRLAPGQVLPAPAQLQDADVESITEFLCGSSTGMPPEFMLQVEALVLGEGTSAERVEAAAALF